MSRNFSDGNYSQSTSQGTFPQGTLREGTFSNGTFREDPIRKGTFYRGTFLEGMDKEGTSYTDIFQGTFPQNVLSRGPFPTDTRSHGATSKGINQVSPTRRDNFLRGTFDEDTFPEGTYQDTTARRGTFPQCSMPVQMPSGQDVIHDTYQPTTGNRGISTVKLNKYNGQTSLNTWLSQFNITAAYNKWDAHTLFVQLINHLTGMAADAILDGGTEELNTYEKVVTALKSRFGTEGQTDKFREELRARRQNTNETLQSLYADIQQLTIKAFPQANAEIRNILGRDAFLEAMIDHECALRIRELDVTTLEGAYKHAVRLQAIHKAAKSSNVSSQQCSVVREKATQRSDDQIIKDMQRRIAQLEASSTVQDVDSMAQAPMFTGSQRMTHRGSQYGNRYGNRTYGRYQNSPRGHGQSEYRYYQPERIRCYLCGKEGHIQRHCSTANTSIYQIASIDQPDVSTDTTVQSLTGTNPAPLVAKRVNSNHSGQLVGTYLDGVINNSHVIILIDTGCTTCILPRRMAEGLSLQPGSTQLIAANGTIILIDGTVRIGLQLKNQKFLQEFIVTDEVDDVILGLSFLTQHDVSWSFNNNTIIINGVHHQLRYIPARPSCRRVMVAQPVSIPPRSQVTIQVKAPFRCWTDPKSAYLLDTTEPSGGLFIARTLIPSTSAVCQLTACNTRGSELHLKEGTIVGITEAAECLNDSFLKERDPVRHQAVEPIISNIIASVPPELTTDQKQRFAQILWEHQQCFLTSEFDLGYTDILEHTIETNNSRPIRETLRRQPLAYQHRIDAHVQSMLQTGVIRPSTSPWSSNVCLVKKKDGSLRFAVDYRKLNSVTTIPSYPMPRVDSCIDSLGKSSWFTTLDLRSAFWQVKMADKDAPKTAFITRQGCYEFTRLPFGLSGSPLLFQRLADLIFSGLQWEQLLVFLDDIIIFANSVESHLQRLNAVLERLCQANLKISPKKCQFFRQEVSFLGFTISKEGVTTNPDKTAAIMEWPMPASTKEVKAFCATVNYYRRHIKDFSTVAAPLYDLTKKGVKFHWMREHQTAFETLKMRLATAPILGIYDQDAETIIDSDASGFGIGAVLSQIIDGKERVIAYASRTLNISERRYSVTKREFLAVIFALKQFRHYILASHFVIRTDHAPLVHIQNMKNPSTHIARWLEFLQEYTFEIRHRPGTAHGNADGLSRRFDGQSQEVPGGNNEITMDILRHIITDDNICQPANASTGHATHADAHSTEHQSIELMEPSQLNTDSTDIQARTLIHVDWATAQEQDPEIAPIYQAKLNTSNRPHWSDIKRMSPATKNLWSEWDQLTMVNNILYRTWFPNKQQSQTLQLIIPRNYQASFVTQCHEGMTGGHLRLNKTIHQVQRRAYFYGWRNTTKRVCRQCTTCQQYHRGKLKHHGEMQNMLVGNIFERLGIDLCGPFPTSYDGKSYILTCTDHFSKWCTATAIPDKKATTIADALIRDVFCIYGTPYEILSDQGPEFDNKLLHSLCEKLHISKIRTSAYQPSTNGVAERIHKTINSMMGRIIEDDHLRWTDHLPYIMAAYRSAVHNATGYSPNFLMFGRELYTPLDIIIKTPSNSQTSSDAYVDRQQNLLYNTYWMVRDQLNATMLTNKRYYDESVRKHSYSVGEWVWYYKPRNQTGQCPKWSRFYSGPFRIMERLSDINYVIQQRPQSQPIVTHVDKLKKYEGTTPIDWVNTPVDLAAEPVDTQNENECTTTAQQPEHNISQDTLPLPDQQHSINVDTNSAQATRPSRVHRQPHWLRDYILETPV